MVVYCTGGVLYSWCVALVVCCTGGVLYHWCIVLVVCCTGGVLYWWCIVTATVEILWLLLLKYCAYYC